MKVSEMMTKNVISCNQDQTVEEAAKTMIDKNVGGLPIVDGEGNLVGIITESNFIGKKVDIPHAMASLTEIFGQTHNRGTIEEIFEKAKGSVLKDVMTENPYTISEDAELSQASALMLDKGVSRLPVVTDGKLVGIITKRDILKSF